METLDEIGLKHKTDKSSMTHCYLGNYEKYFESWRDKEFTLLELGVAAGNSIRMWREYFPNAKVYGIDNNPDCVMDGVFIGSVTDELFMQKVLDEIGEVSILVEDSSHVGWDMIKIFEFLFPKLKNGGYFFLEDTHVIYSPHYEQGSGAFSFFTGLVKDVDVAGRGMTGNTSYALSVENPTFEPIPKYSRLLDSIHIHPSLWIFKRK